jgi:hypothetical protein
MTDDAYNCRPGYRWTAQSHMFPDRIFIRPVLLRESFVDNRHGLGALLILVGEYPAAAQRNLKGCEVIGRNEIDIPVRA